MADVRRVGRTCAHVWSRYSRSELAVHEWQAVVTVSDGDDIACWHNALVIMLSAPNSYVYTQWRWLHVFDPEMIIALVATYGTRACGICHSISINANECHMLFSNNSAIISSSKSESGYLWIIWSWTIFEYTIIASIDGYTVDWFFSEEHLIESKICIESIE